MIEFKPWSKIPRGGTETVVISEKLNGTNSCIIIQEGSIVGCQSRNRIITEEDDNFGFAKWVGKNINELETLGDGYHYGEWAGQGIQKNPLSLEDKQLFLFNTARWNPKNPNLPKCCRVVPLLYKGAIDANTVQVVMAELTQNRSYNPEGVIVWYNKSRRFEKYTYKTPNGKWDKE